MRLLVSLVAAGALSAQACPRPFTPGQGLPFRVESTSTITYSDGYLTDANLMVPDVPAPACGWPLIVFVHRLGASRFEDPALRTMLVGQGFALWTYDVRGQASGMLLHPSNAQVASPGTALWGPVERYDLLEQIQFVAGQPQWQGLVDTGRIAVMGSSQGAVHGWAAAALSGTQVTLAGRGTATFPTIRCAVATDYVAEPVFDWLRDGSLWSMWFVNLICDDVTHPTFVFDQGLWTGAAAAFRAQDPQSLLTAFDTEGRRIDQLLAASTVPVLYSQAYHDLIDSPLSGLAAISGSPVPHRAMLSTIGHNTPFNTAEREYRDKLVVRWLHRWLWDEPNGVELERPFVLSELPIDSTEREDPAFLWTRRQGGDPLQAASPTRLWLIDDGTLQTTEPSQALPSLTIQHQVLDPQFTPANFLAANQNRTLAAIEAACPLSELVYTMTVQDEMSTYAAPFVHLDVVPQATDWMVSAMLTVQPAGGVETMLSSRGVRRTQSQVGVAEVVEFQLPPVATRIPPGSTLRLVLRNLWRREAPMQRVLEVAPLFTPFSVQIRHGDQTQGSWLDLGLAPPRPALVCDLQYEDLATMPPLHFQLRGGLARAGRPYFLAGTTSGQVPGTMYRGDLLPLQIDWMTSILATSLTYPQFRGFLGDLDPQGNANGTFDLSQLAPFDPVLAGMRLTFVGFVWDWLYAPTGAATNAVDVFLR